MLCLCLCVCVRVWICHISGFCWIISGNNLWSGAQSEFRSCVDNIQRCYPSSTTTTSILLLLLCIYYCFSLARAGFALYNNVVCRFVDSSQTRSRPRPHRKCCIRAVIQSGNCMGNVSPRSDSHYRINRFVIHRRPFQYHHIRQYIPIRMYVYVCSLNDYANNIVC